MFLFSIVYHQKILKNSHILISENISFRKTPFLGEKSISLQLVNPQPCVQPLHIFDVQPLHIPFGEHIFRCLLHVQPLRGSTSKMCNPKGWHIEDVQPLCGKDYSPLLFHTFGVNTVKSFTYRTPYGENFQGCKRCLTIFSHHSMWNGAAHGVNIFRCVPFRKAEAPLGNRKAVAHLRCATPLGNHRVVAHRRCATPLVAHQRCASEAAAHGVNIFRFGSKRAAHHRCVPSPLGNREAEGAAHQRCASATASRKEEREGKKSWKVRIIENTPFTILKGVAHGVNIFRCVTFHRVVAHRRCATPLVAHQRCASEAAAHGVNIFRCVPQRGYARAAHHRCVPQRGCATKGDRTSKMSRLHMENVQPLSIHIKELRLRSLLILFSFLLSFFILFLFWKEIVYLFTTPISSFGRFFISTHLAESFGATLKICLAFGVLLNSPLLSYHLYSFFTPSLYKWEKREWNPFFYSSILFPWLFICLTFFAILPFFMEFFFQFQLFGGDNGTSIGFQRDGGSFLEKNSNGGLLRWDEMRTGIEKLRTLGGFVKNPPFVKNLSFVKNPSKGEELGNYQKITSNLTIENNEKWLHTGDTSRFAGSSTGCTILLEPRIEPFVNWSLSIYLLSIFFSQIPLILLYLFERGIFLPSYLVGKRNRSLLFSLLLAAFLSPPDLFSQFLLFSLFSFLFEVSLWGLFFIEETRKWNLNRSYTSSMCTE
jgi:Sec-independent protein secretion pathway component TatC